ncbi:protein kinase superfamily protein [Artemisia annua]|uniref:non-specific serine/threonine protein kinase n=1 Tax=Artemisia annua TaxID=35608 RepID=A0A2U1PN28_ARTAN|nr:protein kinase superfamily protein [Artemisia annua]
MSSRSGYNNNNNNKKNGDVDLWSEIIATDSSSSVAADKTSAVVYRRKSDKDSSSTTKEVSCSLKKKNNNRVSLAPGKRVSWNRSLFTRGRTSIAVAACVPEKEKRIRKQKPPLARAKGAPPQNYEKERAYFQEVDAFELIEESPSPQKKTWVMGSENIHVAPSHLSSVLRKWLYALDQNRSCGPSASLSRILETPSLSRDFVRDGVLDFTSLKTSFETISGGVKSSQNKFNLSVETSLTKRIEEIGTTDEKDSEDIEYAIRNLSLSSRDSLLDELQWDPLSALLAVCGQSSPSTFSVVLSEYCDLQSIVKVGEGTYGEVFVAGETVCKVVPFDGDSLVNGEIQKKAEELLEEVMLSLTLNQLRGNDNHVHNVCPTFIQTLSLRVCDGTYDDSMIRAWEQWDKKHISENDHPTEFAEKQRFVVFVQEHGGQDLESFVLLSFNDARSLLVQVTVALAVAEAAFEFEHRDLHWGNILLSRKSSETLHFVLDGKKMQIKTYGLVASIIDFTLSRINTGEDILFLDLSLDPGLFEGPKGDKQSETYRKMKEVTEDCWEGSFPKTNVLWLQYLVDILLLKKVYDRTSRDERELRSLKKRLNGYNSAKESIVDPFFTDLIVSDI